MLLNLVIFMTFQIKLFFKIILRKLSYFDAKRNGFELRWVIRHYIVLLARQNTNHRSKQRFYKFNYTVPDPPLIYWIMIYELYILGDISVLRYYYRFHMMMRRIKISVRFCIF